MKPTSGGGTPLEDEDNLFFYETRKSGCLEVEYKLRLIPLQEVEGTTSKDPARLLHINTIQKTSVSERPCVPAELLGGAVSRQNRGTNQNVVPSPALLPSPGAAIAVGLKTRYFAGADWSSLLCFGEADFQLCCWNEELRPKNAAAATTRSGGGEEFRVPTITEEQLHGGGGGGNTNNGQVVSVVGRAGTGALDVGVGPRSSSSIEKNIDFVGTSTEEEAVAGHGRGGGRGSADGTEEEAVGPRTAGDGRQLATKRFRWAVAGGAPRVGVASGPQSEDQPNAAALVRSMRALAAKMSQRRRDQQALLRRRARPYWRRTLLIQLARLLGGARARLRKGRQPNATVNFDEKDDLLEAGAPPQLGDSGVSSASRPGTTTSGSDDPRSQPTTTTTSPTTTGAWSKNKRTRTFVALTPEAPTLLHLRCFFLLLPELILDVLILFTSVLLAALSALLCVRRGEKHDPLFNDLKDRAMHLEVQRDFMDMADEFFAKEDSTFGVELVVEERRVGWRSCLC